MENTSQAFLRATTKLVVIGALSCAAFTASAQSRLLLSLSDVSVRDQDCSRVTTARGCDVSSFGLRLFTAGI